MSNEQQRAELHRTIWKIAEDLRGSVDGWEFKSYVLGTLFYRYISESIVVKQMSEAFLRQIILLQEKIFLISYSNQH